MIYIDPPYNTGKDFIYRDNFKQPLKDYLEKTGQIDSEGNKLTTNTEASGRYHSDWLNLIYPRLFLARNLLRDDGVIFVSIDDHEVHHLRMIMDEIFGEENFVSVFVRKSGIAPRQDAKYVATQHDYVVCYSKNISQVRINRKPSETEGFDFEDEYVATRGKYRLNKLDRGSIHYSEGLDYPITTPDGSEVGQVETLLINDGLGGGQRKKLNGVCKVVLLSLKRQKTENGLYIVKNTNWLIMKEIQEKALTLTTLL